jgi:hypothetical protein
MVSIDCNQHSSAHFFWKGSLVQGSLVQGVLDVSEHGQLLTVRAAAQYSS